MARDVYTATVDTHGFISTGRAAEPNAAVAAVEVARAAAVALQPDPTTFEAALAIVVADGATPTQAHVADVNSAYSALKITQTAYVAAVNAITTTAAASSVSADIALLFNAATVVTKNALRKAVAAVIKQATCNASPLSGS